jgi:N-acetylmuramic acid 6-phosphate etherase
MSLEDQLLTESQNPRSCDIDSLDAKAIVALMNTEDRTVVEAVRQESEAIAIAIDLAADRFGRGGRLIYVGAGTSGRLGVLDASECPPTFGTPSWMVIGIIAGGPAAFTSAIEGAEDRAEDGAEEMNRAGVSANDLVVGIATSGRTPFVLGAIERARQLGAMTVGIACNRPSLLGTVADLEIAPMVGPEVIAGSTRLKAGTATKMILNMITTGAMVRIGKTMGNLMVDLRPTNEKLRIRSRRILRDLAGLDEDTAAEWLLRCDGELKPALVCGMTGVSPDEAARLLVEHGGRVREAVAAAIRGGSE